MKNLIFIAIMLFSYSSTFSQEILRGYVRERDENGHFKPLVGANIIWHGTDRGTTTDEVGYFETAIPKGGGSLIVSYIGFSSDTIIVGEQRNIEVELKTNASNIDNVEVVGKKNSMFTDYLKTENLMIITKQELLKAACCNLGESFETNPSIDVSFTDAITGARQIEMLGLSGVYTQTTMENLPFLRGLTSNAGLSFVPGSWINAIHVSKGIGSVANGFESITGQIDIDMQKPFDNEDGENGYLNIYGDNDMRFESNLNYRLKVNEGLASITLLHLSRREKQYDGNSDMFADMPSFENINAMQRWQYFSSKGWESQFGFHALKEKKEGGTIGVDRESSSYYRYGAVNKRFGFYTKTGYVFPDHEHNSFGLQLSADNYASNSYFGAKTYDSKAKNGYANFLFQSELHGEEHKYRIGASFIFDEFEENFNNIKFSRVEKIPGAFIEYTYKPYESFSAIAGFRYDRHNYFGNMYSPRLHTRYTPIEDLVIRGVIGRGYRTTNIFAEYSSSFASSRNIIIIKNNNFGYGLEQESAWNFGINVIYYFTYDYRDATFSIDLYRTQFDNAVIADLDSNPREIKFNSVKNGAYSNSAQAELNIEPIANLNYRMAYRFVETRQKIGDMFMDKPFIAKHRVLVNLQYSTEKKPENSAQYLYDLTIQWFGKKRLPSTSKNLPEFQRSDFSDEFFIVNAQITRSFNQYFDIYIGAENIFDFKQSAPIIDPFNPSGQYFDASIIWAPVSGRMAYLGLRYKM